MISLVHVEKRKGLRLELCQGTLVHTDPKVREEIRVAEQQQQNQRRALAVLICDDLCEEVIDELLKKTAISVLVEKECRVDNPAFDLDPEHLRQNLGPASEDLTDFLFPRQFK